MTDTNDAGTTCLNCGQTKRIYTRGLCAGCGAEWRKWGLPPNTTCAACSRPFYASASSLKRGARFCSERCYGHWKQGRQADGSPARKSEQRLCATCGCEFTALASNIAKGCGIYCSRKCFGVGRRIDPKRTQKDNSVQYWRQAVGFITFSQELIEEAQGCQAADCEATDNLVVHHPIDPNPARDVQLLMSSDNCIVLCRKHHAWLHQGQSSSERFCGICGRKFVARKGQCYCSKSCGVKASWAKRR